MLRISILIAILLLVAMPIHAKSYNEKKDNIERKAIDEQSGIQAQGKFSPAERNLIRAYLLGQNINTSPQEHKNLPPGLQKKVAQGKGLPPGWQKKVSPGNSLDYHVYRQGESLPDILLRRLPSSPVGSEIIQVENKIIRLNSVTRNILDVFDLTPSR